MTLKELRKQISDFLELKLSETSPTFATRGVTEEQGYYRVSIEYSVRKGIGPSLPAAIRWIKNIRRFPGSPSARRSATIGEKRSLRSGRESLASVWTNSGPARPGDMAPDSMCFGDQRRNRMGVEADESTDVEQHYFEIHANDANYIRIFHHMWPSFHSILHIYRIHRPS